MTPTWGGTWPGDTAGRNSTCHSSRARNSNSKTKWTASSMTLRSCLTISIVTYLIWFNPGEIHEVGGAVERDGRDFHPQIYKPSYRAAAPHWQREDIQVILSHCLINDQLTIPLTSERSVPVHHLRAVGEPLQNLRTPSLRWNRGKCARENGIINGLK